MNHNQESPKSPKRAWCRIPEKVSGRDCCCITVDGPPPIRPDLAIYSQEEQLSLGLAPTWNSPGIVTNHMNPLKLLPEIGVEVRNLSPSAAAINGQVSLYISEFGLGMPQSLVSSQTVNIGPSQLLFLQFPLSQAVLAQADQRIGTFLRLRHPFDSKPINNSGSQLIAEAITSTTGRSFSVTFPVRNPLDAPQQIMLEVLPNDLSAAIMPAMRTYAPLEQVMAVLALQVPAATHGAPGFAIQSDVTVIARGAAGELIGGLTYLISIDN